MSEDGGGGGKRPPGLTYSDSGVDIDAGDRAVHAIKDLVRSTYRPEVLGDIGGFGGLFRLPAGYRRPVLVASTDGVGTKLAVARSLGRFTTVGIDLVAMCVDDLVCQGAEPLFFLDYQAHGELSPDVVVRADGGDRRGLPAGRVRNLWGASWPPIPASSRPATSTWSGSRSGSSRPTGSWTARRCGRETC